jgi:hypothetical protein
MNPHDFGTAILSLTRSREYGDGKYRLRHPCARCAFGSRTMMGFRSVPSRRTGGRLISAVGWVSFARGSLPLSPAFDRSRVRQAVRVRIQSLARSHLCQVFQSASMLIAIRL